MSGPPLLPTALPAPAPKQVSSFEFTKRKRWRDLLSAELADAFVLILSAAGRVLYCGSAVSEILGWSNHELVDGDLLEFIPRRSTVSISSRRWGF
jgi:PAS domain-containing protein